MKFTKDSKIVRISAYAEGYYSGATAYGELYVPYDFYKTNEKALSNLSVCVGGLDGKHSEVKCDIEFEEMTIEDYLEEDSINYNDYDREIDESVYYRVCDLLELDEKQSEIANNFSNEISCLEKLSKTEENKITLAEDTLIQGVTVPKGTCISYDLHFTKELKDNWNIEIDWIQ